MDEQTVTEVEMDEQKTMIDMDGEINLETNDQPSSGARAFSTGQQKEDKRKKPELTKLVKFSNEYSFEGKTITSCKMQKPKLKHRRNAMKVGKINEFDDLGTEALLFSNLTSLPYEFLEEEIFEEDYNALLRQYLRFTKSTMMSSG